MAAQLKANLLSNPVGTRKRKCQRPFCGTITANPRHPPQSLQHCSSEQCAMVSSPAASSPARSAQRASSLVVHAAAPAATDTPAASQAAQKTLICTSITATTLESFLAEIEEARSTGVDVIELRLDFIEGFDVMKDLERAMQACGSMPYIVTYRPTWEGGNYDGSEPERLACLKLAAIKGAPYIDVEFKAAAIFFAGAGDVPITTKVILSSHNFQDTPPAEQLHNRAAAMRAAGADIVKIATMANDISDAATVLSLLQNKTDYFAGLQHNIQQSLITFGANNRAAGPTIALAMGEKGQITRLLAAKYGGHLTFAALSDARASAPGQPTINQLQGLYNFAQQGPDTKLYGIIGNPVHHSKSPLIHNCAFRHIGHNGVFVPLLVDNLDRFLGAFKEYDFEGFSVTIPHKEAAFKAVSSCDPVAEQIGACNTLVKQDDGTYKGYNTDWLAAISAIERAIAAGSSDAAAVTSTSGRSDADSEDGASPLRGKTFVVVGAGGAGRALAFGAASRGAKVMIANRSKARAEALAAAVPGGATVVDWHDLQSGAVSADVLANSTSVGMVPNVEDTPVATEALNNFKVVFDAVYTPRETRLLRDAAAAGCLVADGVSMFVGQAVEQLKLFTGTQQPPVQLMEDVVTGKVTGT